MYNEESDNGLCDVDSSRVLPMLGEVRKQFERVVEQENIHHPVNDKNIIVAEKNIVDLDLVVYMKAPAPEFERYFFIG